MGRLASNAEANPSIARLLVLLLLPAFALYGTFNGVQQIVLPLQVEQIDQSGKVGASRTYRNNLFDCLCHWARSRWRAIRRNA